MTEDETKNSKVGNASSSDGITRNAEVNAEIWREEGKKEGKKDKRKGGREGRKRRGLERNRMS